MTAAVRDLPQCAAAGTATCFLVASDPHCAPTGDICAAMRHAAINAGTATVGTCDKSTAKSAPKSVAKAPAKATGAAADVDFDDPDSGWSCTSSEHSTTVGTCKPTPAQCEAFRSKMLERFHDLAPCHFVTKAQCFDVGKEPHCAPNLEICSALRDAAKATAKCAATPLTKNGS